MMDSPPNLEVEITSSGLTISGISIVPNQRLSFYRSILGMPDRTLSVGPPGGDRNHRMHIFDALGLNLLEMHATYYIASISFVWDIDAGPYAPQSPFRGRIRLNATEIAPGISTEKVLGLGFESMFGRALRLKMDGLTILATSRRAYSTDVQLQDLQVVFSTRPNDGDAASLLRFVDAQNQTEYGYATAIEELHTTGKRTHWIWYIFPQLAGLGHSHEAQRYGLRDADEAVAYMRHPVLGARLVKTSHAVVARLREEISLVDLMGSEIDALKLVSSMTLFEHVAGHAGGEFELLEEAAAEILDRAKKQGFCACQFTLNRVGVE